MQATQPAAQHQHCKNLSTARALPPGSRDTATAAVCASRTLRPHDQSCSHISRLPGGSAHASQHHSAMVAAAYLTILQRCTRFASLLLLSTINTSHLLPSLHTLSKSWQVPSCCTAAVMQLSHCCCHGAVAATAAAAAKGLLSAGVWHTLPPLRPSPAAGLPLLNIPSCCSAAAPVCRRGAHLFALEHIPQHDTPVQRTRQQVPAVAGPSQAGHSRCQGGRALPLLAILCILRTVGAPTVFATHMVRHGRQAGRQ